MWDRVFQALFAYRPDLFHRGELRFNVTTGAFIATVIVAVVIIAAVLTYRRVRVGEGRPRDRVILTALRVAALALLLFCLFRPTLIVRAAVPQQNVVAVAVDCSKSMQIPDWGGKPRGEYVRQQLGDASSPLLKSLSDRFQVRLFCFSSSVARANSAKELTFNGSQTRFGPALDGVRDELAGLPLAGVVLLSDGADTSETSLTKALLGMKAAKLPVFTVAVGSEKLAHDIQIDRVTMPRTVRISSSIVCRASSGPAIWKDSEARSLASASETKTRNRPGAWPGTEVSP